LSIDAAAIWANGLVNDQKNLRLFEIIRFLVRLDQIASFIVNANHSVMNGRKASSFR
jgi:hypothetical protein